MVSPNVLEFTDQNFADQVLKSPIPVLAWFSATWSGPCKQIAPIIGQIADDYQGRIKVGKLDIDDSPETTKEYYVKTVPMCVVFRGGQKTGVQAGLTDRNTLLRLLGLG
ncbi:MAG TPA: thioredoxin domain-containing protein [Blastocatellia bacterium]|nr:thioredoxin domain-containing protein [Blastocatellia bacterium]HMX28522.1 thioredoxin domain-containing protein [Blastocatellia bacterium]HMY76179.1 thioredoxin domain-containing protein [Blastocatellia bacterium]HMZ21372.1 thioredoxin domain-containing protein [Blastocatellia bacterium]HNG30842.1 thioredoxin domain-containing protein [Blastocatellia bacterium]